MRELDIRFSSFTCCKKWNRYKIFASHTVKKTPESSFWRLEKGCEILNPHLNPHLDFCASAPSILASVHSEFWWSSRLSPVEPGVHPRIHDRAHVRQSTLPVASALIHTLRRTAFLEPGSTNWMLSRLAGQRQVSGRSLVYWARQQAIQLVSQQSGQAAKYQDRSRVHSPRFWLSRDLSGTE